MPNQLPALQSVNAGIVRIGGYLLEGVWVAGRPIQRGDARLKDDDYANGFYTVFDRNDPFSPTSIRKALPYQIINVDAGLDEDDHPIYFEDAAELEAWLELHFFFELSGGGTGSGNCWVKILAVDGDSGTVTDTELGTVTVLTVEIFPADAGNMVGKYLVAEGQQNFGAKTLDISAYGLFAGDKVVLTGTYDI